MAARLPAHFHIIAADRPGYGSSRLAAGGFAANARALLDDLDTRGIQRAVLVGHSYGGGVALSVASLAPRRVLAVILLASVGPGCVTGWDRLLAARGAGPLCALVAWRLTPWIARARLARIGRRRGRPLTAGEYVTWQLWGLTERAGGRPLWRTFLTEQRALLRELGELECALPSVRAPVLLLADPSDTLVPSPPPAGSPGPCRMLACSSSAARVTTCPGAPPMPSPVRSWRSWQHWRIPAAKDEARGLTFGCASTAPRARPIARKAATRARPPSVTGRPSPARQEIRRPG